MDLKSLLEAGQSTEDKLDMTRSCPQMDPRRPKGGMALETDEILIYDPSFLVM